jgi:hypothetical protein
MGRADLDSLLHSVLWSAHPYPADMVSALSDQLREHGDDASADHVLRGEGRWYLARHGDTGELLVRPCVGQGDAQ